MIFWLLFFVFGILFMGWEFLFYFLLSCLFWAILMSCFPDKFDKYM